jgi:acyl dehydratase
MADRRYLEDLVAGEKRLSPPVTITEEAALEFSRLYDPQPMHIDPQAAASGMFGGIIVSGWHTAALTMRMLADVAVFGTGDVLGLGVERITWPVPVRPGDTLQSEVEIESIRPSKSNPGFGVVKLKVTVRNQRGEVVYTFNPSCWVPRRPPAGSQA